MRCLMRKNTARCSSCVKPSILKCTSVMQYIHCLCVSKRRDLRNCTPHLSNDRHGCQRTKDGRMHSNSKVMIRPLTKQSQPRRSCAWAMGRNPEPIGTQHSIRVEPCPCRYVLMVQIRSGSADALSRQATTASINSWSNFTWPICLHLVRCFDVSRTMPQFGHTLEILVSQSERLLFEPHHPDTCFVMKIRNILG